MNSLSLLDEDFADLEDLEDMLFLMNMAALVERDERLGTRSRRRKSKRQKRLARAQPLPKQEVRSRRKLNLEEEYKQTQPSFSLKDTEKMNLDLEEMKIEDSDFQISTSLGKFDEEASKTLNSTIETKLHPEYPSTAIGALEI